MHTQNKSNLPGKKPEQTERHPQPEMKKTQGSTAPGSSAAPSASMHTPDANVGMSGECIVPQHPESVRADTGEPCDDGRAGGA